MSPAQRSTRTLRALGGLAALALLTEAPAVRAEAQAFAEAGPEVLGGGWFALVEPGLRFESEPFTVELRAPLRMRLNPGMVASEGWVRREDWDSVSDAGRVLRRLELSLAERSFVLNLGSFAHQSQGRGTVVNGFGNALDPDRMPVGAVARVVAGALTADVLAADLLDPGVLAGSLTLEPFSLAGRTSDRVHLSTTVAGDRTAGASVVLWGTGLDVAVWRAEHVKLAPYVDLNGRGGALGLHAGLLADFSAAGARVSLKGEWRRFRDPYVPELFDVAWPVERLSPAPGDPPAPDGADVSDGARTWNAWRAEARATLGGLAAGAALSTRGRGRTDASLVTSLELEAVQAAVFVAARDLDSARRPEAVHAMAELRYRIAPFLHVWATAGRLYRLLPEPGGVRTVPSNQVGAGIGGAVASR